MSSLNKVILLGRVGKDPEVRYTGNGTAVASFSLATNERYKDKSGEWKDKTEWHNITLWGKLAEICGEYVAKGKNVLIEGKLSTRKWQDKSGDDRYTTEVVGEKMVMLSGKGEGGGRGASRQQEDTGFCGSQSYEEPVFNPDDDIPF